MAINVKGVTFYDLEELSKKTNLCVRTLREYIKKGKLEGKKKGRKYYVSDEEIKRYMEAA